MNRNELPKILFDKMRMVKNYPNGVVQVPKMVDTTAFFPGGTGLWNCNEQIKFPTILVLGQDFSNLVEYEKILNGIVKDTDCATWRNLIKVFKEAGVKLEDCFFSNVFMGLRETASMTGEFPGYKHNEFVDKNLEFLNFQIETIKPKLIITLGKYAAEMITRAASKGLENWKDFNALRGGDIGFVKDVSFGDMKVDCVALEHPSMRVQNLCRRKYCDSKGTSYKGHDAEINMIKDALKRLEGNNVDDKVIHINIMNERVNENVKKPGDEYYTENEKAFGDLLNRISKEIFKGNDREDK